MGRTMGIIIGLAAVVVLGVAACHEGGESDACDGVDCSGHGECWSDGSRSECRCDDGYHPEGLDCVDDSSSDGDGDADSDSDADSDADADSDSDADSDGGGDGDADGEGGCDPFALSSCTSREKCAFVSSDGGVSWSTECVPQPVDGPGPLEECSTSETEGRLFDNCPQGYVCGDRAEVTDEAICFRLCASGRENLCEGIYDGHDGLCLFPTPRNGATGGSETRACSPVDDCDPRCSDECGRSGDGCYSAWDNAAAGTVCLPPGTASASCDDSTNACAVGFHCWDGACRRYCTLSGAPSCAAFGACPSGSCADPGDDAMFTSIGLGLCPL